MNDDEDRVPADVVPRGQWTREALGRLAEATRNGQVQMHEPGELVEGPNGEPVSVGPTKTTAASLPFVVITRADADRLGITREEYPHVRIID